jgi:hypothetical protein
MKSNKLKNLKSYLQNELDKASSDAVDAKLINKNVPYSYMMEFYRGRSSAFADIIIAIEKLEKENH